MTGTRILVVQPSEIDPPQRLGEWLAGAGAELHVVPGSSSDLPEHLEGPGGGGYEGLVVLGGEMGALDDAEYPWLARVRGLLSGAVSARIPVLSVCLGAQLLAVATAGQVRRASNGPDVGTGLVAKRDAAADDPLLGSLALTPDVLQFRQDEIRTLPPSAVLLVASPSGENQAFRVGECAYGLQFHIETTTGTVLDWARRMPEMAGTARPHQLESDHLDAFHEDLAETWRPVAEEFVRLAATPPDERNRRRELPLA